MAQHGAVAPIGWVREIVLNASDPAALARFWARLLGGTPTEWYDGWVTLEPPPHGQRLSFQRTAGRAGQNDGMHFDVLVEDLEAAHAAVLAAGGSFVASTEVEAAATEAGLDRQEVSEVVGDYEAAQLQALKVALLFAALLVLASFFATRNLPARRFDELAAPD